MCSATSRRCLATRRLQNHHHPHQSGQLLRPHLGQACSFLFDSVKGLQRHHCRTASLLFVVSISTVIDSILTVTILSFLPDGVIKEEADSMGAKFTFSPVDNFKK
jgi:hypothetical protein